jgi:hypothetical protein
VRKTRERADEGKPRCSQTGVMFAADNSTTALVQAAAMKVAAAA